MPRQKILNIAKMLWVENGYIREWFLMVGGVAYDLTDEGDVRLDKHAGPSELAKLAKAGARRHGLEFQAVLVDESSRK